MCYPSSLRSGPSKVKIHIPTPLLVTPFPIIPLVVTPFLPPLLLLTARLSPPKFTLDPSTPLLPFHPKPQRTQPPTNPPPSPPEKPNT